MASHASVPVRAWGGASGQYRASTHAALRVVALEVGGVEDHSSRLPAGPAADHPVGAGQGRPLGLPAVAHGGRRVGQQEVVHAEKNMSEQARARRPSSTEARSPRSPAARGGLGRPKTQAGDAARRVDAQAAWVAPGTGRRAKTLWPPRVRGCWSRTVVQSAWSRSHAGSASAGAVVTSRRP